MAVNVLRIDIIVIEVLKVRSARGRVGGLKVVFLSVTVQCI